MLDSVEKVYHAQSARIIQLRLAEGVDHSLMTMSFFDTDTIDFALQMPHEPWPEDRILEWQIEAATRIRARCTDLVEVKSFEQVEFLHRTVRDFLLERDVHDLLQARSTYTLSPKDFSCAALLAQVKMYGDNELQRYLCEHAIDGLLRTALDIERSCAKACVPIMDELNTTLLAKLDQKRMILPFYRWVQQSVSGYYNTTLIIQIALNAYLDLYVQHKINENPGILMLTDEVSLISLLVGYNGRVWQTELRSRQPSMPIGTSGERCTANEKLLDYLLRCGARPNDPEPASSSEVSSQHTVWTRFLRSLLFASNLPRLHLFNLTQLLLKHGASPEVQIQDPMCTDRPPQERPLLGLLDIVERGCGVDMKKQLESWLRRHRPQINLDMNSQDKAADQDSL